MNIDGAIQNTIDKLEGWLESFIESLPNIVVAVLITVAFVFVARLVRKLFLKVVNRFSDSPTVNRLGANIIYVAVVAAGIFVALGVMHLDKTVTSLLAGAGIIGLALSFAFQDVATNLISGIYLAINRPIQQNDLILTNDLQGRVRKVNLRSTLLQTFQGQMVTVPNRKIFENPIVNYTTNGERRIDLEVGVSFSDDLPKAEKVVREAILSLKEHLTQDTVNVFWTGFGDSSINLVVHYWCDAGTQACYLSARSAGIKAIKSAFDREGISIPFPIRTLEFSEGSNTLALERMVESTSN